MTYVIFERFVLGGDLFYSVGYETEDGPDPQEGGEAAEQLLTELDPLGRRLGGREGVGAVSF